MFNSHRLIVVGLCAVLITVGCVGGGPTARQRFLEDTLVHARIYRRHRDYEAAKWLADRVLCKGMSQETVESLLVDGEPWPHFQSVRYYTRRDVTWADVLVIRYRNGLVEGWEWASE